MLSWVAGFITLLIGDMIWLGYVMQKSIREDFKEYVAFNKDGSIQIRLGIGLLAWAIISFGVVYFVTFQETSLLNTLLVGGLFGFILYACYDLTNYTFFKNYSVRFLIIDIIWGAIICSLVAGASFSVKTYLGGIL